MIHIHFQSPAMLPIPLPTIGVFQETKTLQDGNAELALFFFFFFETLIEK